MAVYYKFKSAKDYDSIPIDGHFISVANLKEKIFESKHLGRGTDFDLMVANAQTNEEYLDEAALIPKNTSVLVRRIPGRPRMPIVTEREETKPIDNKEEDVQSSKSGLPLADASIMKYPEETEWDEFGNDLYAIPEMLQVQSSNMVQEATLSNKADEDSKIKALVDNSALDWLRQPQDAFGAGRGFGRGMGGRMMGARGFGRGGSMFERKTPPAGYICHRCKIPGHFIQHCPTNGDPNYDIKKVKPPTGIPKSMLMATPDGSYALPSGAVAVLKPNEAAFEKEIEGLPSTRSVTDIPPELRCPLCKEVMKDAVLTSKCCFKSFCDKCIRDHIISKSACICGATNVLADDLLPNKTLRDTIYRLLESNNSSAENAGSMLQIQDMESARPSQPKIPSPSLSAAPTLSAASKGELMPPPPSKDNVETKEIAIESQDVSKSPVQPQQSAPTGPRQSASTGPQQNGPTGTQQLVEKGRTAKAADISEATHESMMVKETTSQGSAAVVEEEVQQRPSASEPGKKKKKKKVRVPLNGAELQWRTPQDFAADGGYGMMPYGPSACNPYWGGMVGMDGFMNPYAGTMPYMGYVPGPFDVPLGGMGGMLPQDPFGGYMMPVVPPQRDLSELAMGAKPGPPVMSREEFEARKADLRRKREMEQRGAERGFSKERDYSRELSGSGDVPSMKSKHKSTSSQAEPSEQRRRHHQRSERSLTPERPPIHHHRDHRDELAPPSPTRAHHHRHRPDKATSLDRPPRDSYDPPRPSKRRAEHNENPAAAPPRKRRPTSEALEDEELIIKAASLVQDGGKHKGSVFSRISFPEGESAGGAKKQKRKAAAEADGHVMESKKDHRHSSHHHHSSSDVIRSTTSTSTSHGTREDVPLKVGSGGGGGGGGSGSGVQPSRRGSSVSMDNDSSDEERHFKRRPLRYEPPPLPVVEREQDARHSRGERERERERAHRHR